MSKYKVTFTKYETYYVNANSPDEAENQGFDLLDADKTAFMFDPVDSVSVIRESNYSIRKLSNAIDACLNHQHCNDCPYNHNGCKEAILDNAMLICNKLEKFIDLEDIENIKEIKLEVKKQ